MAASLLALGAGSAACIGTGFFLVMAAYYGLTTAYSLVFKKRMILDICVLAGLYAIRIVAGGVATSTPLSVWGLAFAIFFFLSLAAVTRQVELVDNAKQGKLEASGRSYTVEDLPIVSMISISAGYVAVLVMALHVNSPAILELYSMPETLWAVCAVLLYWITRTVLPAHRGELPDDPVVFSALDGTSRICFLIILGRVIAGAVL